MTASDIRATFSDPPMVMRIKKELNEEICYCPILRNLNRELKSGVIYTTELKFKDLGAEDRNEVFVYLGRILESVLTCQLSEAGYSVKKDRSSSGDLTITEDIWEIKGTSGKNSWTGSTHASMKEDKAMDFIGIKYGIDEDANVFDVLNGTVELIPHIFIGVFEQLNFIRRGSATKSNSRTSLLISVDDYAIVKNQVAWGDFRLPRNNGKYLQLIAA